MNSIKWNHKIVFIGGQHYQSNNTKCVEFANPSFFFRHPVSVLNFDPDGGYSDLYVDPGHNEPPSMSYRAN